MLELHKKTSFIPFTETWFDYKFKWSDLVLPNCYKSVTNENRRFYVGIKKQATSAVLSLDKPADELFNNFAPGIQRGIKKAEAAGVQCFFSTDIKAFIEFHNVFAGHKNIEKISMIKINEFRPGCWKFSYAVLNGQVLAAHSYLEDVEAGIVRGMYAASVRLNEQHPEKATRYAGMLLYYFNIRHYTEKGFRFFDFGGWSNSQGLLEYKMSFGAKPIYIFNVFSYPYFIKDKLAKMVKMLKRN